MWPLLAGLLTILLAAVYLLLRSKRLAPAVSSEVANIATLGVAIFALIVSMATYYDAEKSSATQQKTLDSSRQALDSVVGVAQKQQALLDRALQVSETHLKLAELQRAEELERRGRRPKLEISVGQATASDLRLGKLVTVTPNAQRVATIVFLINNVGNAPVIRPVFVVRALLEAITLHAEGQRGGPRPNPNIFQLGGPNVLDLLPATQNPNGYRFGVDAVIPEPVSMFAAEVTIGGENLPAPETLKIGFDVIQRPTQ